MKNLLLILSCFFFACVNAQTTGDSLGYVPDKFDVGIMTDSTRFRPQLFNGLPDDYSFKIYDKWGQVVFETNIPEQGWNGRFQNRMYPCGDGAYMWMMSCEWKSDSLLLNTSGFVTVSNSFKSQKIIALDTLQCRPTILVPNVMTPNGDGLNEYFTPIFGCPPVEYEMQIFDRWGNPVFVTTSSIIGWDGNLNGRPAEMGTYVWKIKCRYYEGDEKHEYVGHVVLIR